MFWLNYRAIALAGFHACAIRAEVSVVFTTGENCSESVLFHLRNGFLFVFFLRSEAGVNAESRLLARWWDVDQERHLLQFPAIRNSPVGVIGASGDLNLIGRRPASLKPQNTVSSLSRNPLWMCA